VTTTEENELPVGEDGPFALCADTVNRKMYFLCYDKDNTENAVIFVVDMESNTIADKVPVGPHMFTTTPYGGSIMTNYMDNKLLVVAEGKMIVVDPVAKTTKTLNDYESIEYLTYSPNTGNIYAVAKEEEDEMSASQYHYSLYCITPNQKQLILKFRPELEITDVHYADSAVCVNSRTIGRDEEHSFWVLNEIKNT
jgi:hypothetical protein